MMTLLRPPPPALGSPDVLAQQGKKVVGLSLPRPKDAQVTRLVEAE